MENDSQFQKKFITYLKVSFLTTWVAVLAVFAWPLLKPGMGDVFNFPELAFAGAEDVGLILEPMKPITDRGFVATTVSFPTSPAQGVDGYYVSGSFTTKDLRVLALQRFLSSKGSPMAAHADTIVQVSDSSNVDYRTFVSISGVESGFGKVGHAARVGHNPIGWRGGPGGKFNIFGSWDESINFLVPRLARIYGSEPDPFLIQSTYCPPCGAAGTNEWAHGVTRYLNEIEIAYKTI
jgi:hypothetical protein